MGFRLTEHTADVGVEAWGQDLGEAFAEAARGMTSVVVDPDTLEERDRRRIEVQAGDREELLVRWLNELVFLFDSEGLAFRRFDVERWSDRELVAEAHGERVEPGRHAIGTHVKAATFHRLVVEPGPPARVRVILDV